MQTHRLDSLLRHEAIEGLFLDDEVVSRPLLGVGEIVRSRIGGYRISDRIGEGEFGEVYRAEQIDPVRREVALKLIKPGFDTHEIILRFESEREALASISHPNIAQVFDAGLTDHGHPYFVMELACGVPITNHCDDHLLQIPARLELFMKVCRAVEHAHLKGIIHRDLKPSNIVVTHEGGVPVPKIIDFGISKSLQGPLIGPAVFTRGDLFLNSPAYMSPERFLGDRGRLDTRTDIYSLGVLLYELMTGPQPFDADMLRHTPLTETRNIICEVEPPKPSTRAGTNGFAANSVANHRATDPPTLERMLRGDLDWIVMKAMEKDCDRRYQGAAELAQDIARHLENKPVQAGPHTTAYRLGKLVRRHAVGVTAAAAAVTALLLGLVLLLAGS